MRAALSLFLLSLPSACSAQAPMQSAQADWQPLVQVSFESDGETPWVSVPTSGSGVALRVTAEAGVCFELSGAATPDGEPLTQRFAGPECPDCPLRTSVAAEAGVFVLSSAAQVRFGVTDCETLNPREIAAGKLEVEVKQLAAPESSVLPLRLFVARDSTLLSDGNERQRLLAAVDDELGRTGVTTRLVDVEPLPAPAGTLRFHAGDASELAELLAEHPGDAREVRVVIAGCLEYADPLFGPPVAVDGYTPRVLGGAGAADGVFLPELDCTSSFPLSITPEARGRILAHELGHYLGLFHTDPDRDGDANLMNPNPSLSVAHGLTNAQIEALRRHPVLQ